MSIVSGADKRGRWGTWIGVKHDQYTSAEEWFGLTTHLNRWWKGFVDGQEGRVGGDKMRSHQPSRASIDLHHGI
jgi:hypothetical protein